MALLLLLFLPLAYCRQFTVDYKKNCFLKDDQCYQLISGSMHYIRAPDEYWEDRISKFRAAGLNTIQSYIPWFVHAPYPDKFSFGGRANITKFIALTQKYELNLILRAGPYMCGEVDFGGLPWWLLKKYPDIKVRTSDKRYLAEVEKYYKTLFPIIKPHLYVNGGNIISIQVENEYGSFPACDRQYTKWLRDLFRKELGNDVLLFTTDGDGDGYLKCGTIPNVFPTVDFGSTSRAGVKRAFRTQMKYSKGGPAVNSEFYPGWLDLWGGSHAHTDTGGVVSTMNSMWGENASFNFYMFFGGTNFGYVSGAEGDADTKFQPITTSYDYDAPLSEAGDPTPKYTAIRSAIQQHTGKEIPYPVPKPSTKIELGKLEFKKIGTIYDYLNIVGSGSVKATYPLNVEAMDHPYGFVLYQTKIRGVTGTSLTIPGVRDRAYVIRNNKELLGVIQRPSSGVLRLRTPLGENDQLTILVENQGRVCYGSFMSDVKGLVGNVTLNGHILTKFDIFPITLEALVRTPPQIPVRRRRRVDADGGFMPSFYEASVEPSSLSDTFLDPSGWGKGQLS